MAKEIKKTNVLAEGEVTGHAHRCTETATVMEYNDGTKTLNVTKKGTTITHEEHKHINIPEGEYSVHIQREEDPDTREARQVAD